MTGDDPILCRCYRVTEGTIREHIRRHSPASVEEVLRATSASSGCGSCAEDVRRLLQAGRDPWEEEARQALE